MDAKEADKPMRTTDPTQATTLEITASLRRREVSAVEVADAFVAPAEGLPVGAQLVGRRFEDAAVARAAGWIEAAQGAPFRHPRQITLAQASTERTQA